MVGASRFGLHSPTKVKLGLTETELQIVVATMACERAERGFPTRDAIAQVAPHGDVALVSRLAARGWLERRDGARKLPKGERVTYRATAFAWAALGFEWEPIT